MNKYNYNPHAVVTFIEPLPNGKCVTRKLLADEIVNMMRKRHADYEFMSDYDVLMDFITIHWAKIEDNNIK